MKLWATIMPLGWDDFGHLGIFIVQKLVVSVRSKKWSQKNIRVWPKNVESQPCFKFLISKNPKGLKFERKKEINTVRF